jgi:hypothetical protein
METPRAVKLPGTLPSATSVSCLHAPRQNLAMQLGTMSPVPRNTAEPFDGVIMEIDEKAANAQAGLPGAQYAAISAGV